MAVFDFFRPKWQHSDPVVRLDAVKKIVSTEVDLLVKIITTDVDVAVCRAALSRIDDLAFLQSLRDIPDFPAELSADMAEKIDRFLVQNILSHADITEKRASLAALEHSNSLATVAVGAEEVELRLGAVKKIADHELLLDIVGKNCGREPGLAAIKKIEDVSLLQSAVKNGSSKHIRAAAREKLHTLSGPTPEEIEADRCQQIQDVIDKAEKLTVLPDPERASHEMLDVVKEWQALPGPIDDEPQHQFVCHSETIKSRLQNFSHHETRLVHEEETQNAEITKLEDSLHDMEVYLECPDDDAVVKFTAGYEQFQTGFQALDSPPAHLMSCADSLQQKFLAARNIYKSEEHIFAKLLGDMQTIEEMLEGNKLLKIPSHLSELRDSVATQAFIVISTSDIEEKIIQLEQRYEDAKMVIDAEKTKAATKRRANLEGRLQLIAELKDLDGMEDRAAAETRLKEIKDIWRQHVALPSDSTNLEESYSQALDAFHDRQREYYKERDWQSWNNKNGQELLIGEMVALAKETDLHLAFKKMQALQEKWRNTGSCTPKDAKGLWSRFHEASEVQFKRCQVFFAELDEKAVENSLKKRAIIDQIQEVQDSESWQKTSDILKQLQKEWKIIGRAPKDKENNLYQEFRESCDHFFNRRSAHYKELADKRLENLAQKEELCKAVESLLVEPEESHHEKIKKFQLDWKEIGAAPKEKENEIWLRFRGLCDQFYKWLETLQPENLKKKELLCQRLDEAMAQLDADRANIGKIAAQVISLQKEWRTIGPAPKEDNNKIWGQFRKTCDTFFEQRKNHFAAIDKERPGNEVRKNEIIKQALNVSQENSRVSVKTIISLQEEWKSLGPASQKNEPFLERKFKDVCNEFFRGRRQHFEELDVIRRENLKKKEELCIRLELITGVEQPKRHGPPGTKNSSLTLAEQLKLAFEENFVMAGSDKSSQRRKKDEIKQIEIDWHKITGQVPKEHINYIQRRYENALKAGLALKS